MYSKTALLQREKKSERERTGTKFHKEFLVIEQRWYCNLFVLFVYLDFTLYT